MFFTFLECSQISGVFFHSVIHGLGFFICFMIQSLHGKSDKTRFFYVLYPDKTWVLNLSERVQGPSSIIMENIISEILEKYSATFL